MGIFTWALIVTEGWWSLAGLDSSRGRRISGAEILEQKGEEEVLEKIPELRNLIKPATSLQFLTITG